MAHEAASGGEEQTASALRGRRRYLRAATRLALGDADRPGAGDHLAALIHMNDLAQHAGLSRSALYRAWPSRDELWADLVEYIALEVDLARPIVELPWAARMGTGPSHDFGTPSGMDAVRERLNMLNAITADDPIWPVRATALAYPEPSAVAERRHRSELRRGIVFGDLIDAELRHLGLALPGPFRVLNLAEATHAVLDGLVVTSHWYEPFGEQQVLWDDGIGPQPWLLPSWMTRAVVLELATLSDADPPREPPLGAAAGQEADAADSERREWTAVQSRVLRAGLEELLDRMASEHRDALLAVLPQVTIERIARACRVTRRSVYDIWATRDRMLLDLLDALLWADHEQQVEITSAVWRPGTPPDLSPEVAARNMFASEHDHALEIVVSAFLPQSRRPDVRNLLVHHHRNNLSYLATHLARLDPPLQGATASQLAEILVALLAGLRRLRRVHGPAGWSGDLGVTFGWTLSTLCSYRPLPSS